MSRRTKVVSARLGAFSELRRFVDETCAAADVGRDDTLRLVLMVEELFTNTVVHGHRGDSDAPIRVDLEVGDDGIVVTYEDTAPAYDPFTAMVADVGTDTLEQRAAGGLGVPLVRRLATRFQYTYGEGRNRITVVSPRRPRQ